jgi:hypothetical protein
MNLKFYDFKEISTVYKRHRDLPNSVLYSTDGYNWKSVPHDSSKWNIQDWKFAFLEIECNYGF